jgi:hypothetical protein
VAAQLKELIGQSSFVRTEIPSIADYWEVMVQAHSWHLLFECWNRYVEFVSLGYTGLSAFLREDVSHSEF